MGLNPIVQMAFGCAPLCIRLAAFLSAVNASWCQLVCQRHLRTLLKLQLSSSSTFNSSSLEKWRIRNNLIASSCSCGTARGLLPFCRCLRAVTASTSCADHRLRQFVTASFEVVTLQNCNYEPLRCGFRSLDIQWQSALPIEARRNHRTINQMLWSSHKDINGVYSPEMQVATFSVPLNNILTNQGSLHHAGLFSS